MYYNQASAKAFSGFVESNKISPELFVTGYINAINSVEGLKRILLKDESKISGRSKFVSTLKEIVDESKVPSLIDYAYEKVRRKLKILKDSDIDNDDTDNDAIENDLQNINGDNDDVNINTKEKREKIVHQKKNNQKLLQKVNQRVDKMNTKLQKQGHETILGGTSVKSVKTVTNKTIPKTKSGSIKKTKPLDLEEWQTPKTPIRTPQTTPTNSANTTPQGTPKKQTPVTTPKKVPIGGEEVKKPRTPISKKLDFDKIDVNDKSSITDTPQKSTTSPSKYNATVTVAKNKYLRQKEKVDNFFINQTVKTSQGNPLTVDHLKKTIKQRKQQGLPYTKSLNMLNEYNAEVKLLKEFEDNYNKLQTK